MELECKIRGRAEQGIISVRVCVSLGGGKWGGGPAESEASGISSSLNSGSTSSGCLLDCLEIEYTPAGNLKI